MAGARLNMTLTSAKGAFAAGMPRGREAGEAARSGMKCKAMRLAVGGPGRAGLHTIVDRAGRQFACANCHRAAHSGRRRPRRPGPSGALA